MTLSRSVPDLSSDQPVRQASVRAITSRDCKFFDCAGSNGRYGGAITVGNAGSVVRGCLFVNCANTGTGGAISFYGAGLVENCTIIGCRSTGTTTGAGGIDVFGSPGTVRNCIVYGCENDAGEANINATKGIAVEYTATAPLLHASSAKSCPSTCSPGNATYKSPGFTSRESQVTPVAIAPGSDGIRIIPWVKLAISSMLRCISFLVPLSEPNWLVLQM